MTGIAISLASGEVCA